MERVANKNRIIVALAILAVALITVTVFVCASRSFSFAEAESETKVESEYITGNYYNFGKIIAISAQNSTFYTVECIDENAYIRIVENNKLIKLENTAKENYDSIEIVAFANRLFIKQDDGIYSYSLSDGVLSKYLPLTYEYYLDDNLVVGEYKSFGGAVADGVLIIDFTSIIVFYDVTKPEDGKITSFAVNSTNSFDKMIVENPQKGEFVLHLYDSKNGNMFTRKGSYNSETGKYSLGVENTQNALEILDSVDLYTYFGGGLTLGVGGLYKNGEKVIKINSDSDNGASDEYIKQYSKIAVDGDYLYVVDNGQNAVKVFNSDFELYALYGSYGQGVGDNDRGLTRFRSPKFLCYDAERLALFDEGNARIVLMNHSLQVLATYSTSGVSGLCLKDGIWVSSNKTLYKFDYDFKLEKTYTHDAQILSLTTDSKNVFVRDSKKIYIVGDSFAEYNSEITISGIMSGGKHEGVFYDVAEQSVIMYKDGKVIISCDVPEHDYFSIDCRGNLFGGKGKNIYVYLRQLDGFVEKTFETELDLNEVVITANGSIFGISQNGLAKITYSEIVSSESDFVNPSITYPVKAIRLKEECLGYVRPDNYESVIEADAKSYVLFAKTTFEGHDYYYTEALKNGRYVDLYIPAEYAEELADGNIDNEFIKYGGTDLEPKAYEYPSLTASAVCSIVKGQSYKVLRVVADDWKWYEIQVDDKICYVNGANYISAEPLYKTVERYYLRAKSDVLGEQVTLYSSPDENSEIIDYVGEGTVLELTEPYDENSEFLQIRYNKGIAYVKTKNIQKDGLTESQKFALCFAGAVVGLTAVFGVLSLIVRRRKSEK